MTHFNDAPRTIPDQAEKAFMKAVARHKTAYLKVVQLRNAHRDAEASAHRCHTLTQYLPLLAPSPLRDEEKLWRQKLPKFMEEMEFWSRIVDYYEREMVIWGPAARHLPPELISIIIQDKLWDTMLPPAPGYLVTHGMKDQWQPGREARVSRLRWMLGEDAWVMDIKSMTPEELAIRINKADK
ncbi:MAG: hypothetical protein Q9213_007027 [Squamulea squamosa]